MAFDHKTPTDHDLALEAVKQRPDIPKELVDNAWKIGPRWVIALCQSHPTPEQLNFEEQERRRRLRLQEVRRVAAQALEAKLCLDGNLERMDDSTRRDVAILLGSDRPTIEMLAVWSARDATGDIATHEEWVRVRTAAESKAVVDLLFKTHSAIQSAIAESHVPKRNRRSRLPGGYAARSKA
jgi:hypothetical protein